MSAITSEPRLRRATRDDVPDVITVLSAAFRDDPVFSWVFPDADRRQRLLPDVFALFTYAYLPHQEVYFEGGSVAMWAPVGEDPMAANEDRITAEMAGIVGPDAERMFTIAALTHGQVFAEAHAHLQFLGVEPDSQGRGLGSALLAPVLARCDGDGVAAHLDATSERSRALYERHGFVVIDELRAPGAPPLWSMWRSPRS